MVVDEVLVLVLLGLLPRTNAHQKRVLGNSITRLKTIFYIDIAVASAVELVHAVLHRVVHPSLDHVLEVPRHRCIARSRVHGQLHVSLGHGCDHIRGFLGSPLRAGLLEWYDVHCVLLDFNVPERLLQGTGHRCSLVYEMHLQILRTPVLAGVPSDRLLPQVESGRIQDVLVHIHSLVQTVDLRKRKQTSFPIHDLLEVLLQLPCRVVVDIQALVRLRIGLLRPLHRSPLHQTAGVVAQVVEELQL